MEDSTVKFIWRCVAIIICTVAISGATCEMYVTKKYIDNGYEQTIHNRIEGVNHTWVKREGGN